MFSILLKNIALITILTIMYLASLGTNTILGLYHNLNDAKENFSKDKLISGLIRGGIILLGALLITAIISLLPEVLAAFGVTAEAALFESISVIGMGGVMASTVMRYLTDAVKKLYVILGAKSESKEEA